MKQRTTIPGDPVDWSDRPGVRLLVIGNGSYETYNLPTAGTVTIGRAETADIRLEDLQASRSHARLTIGNVLFVEDLGSINGTRVRDRPIARGERVPVQSGETIAIGSSVLIVHVRSRRPEGVTPDSPTYAAAGRGVLTSDREDAMKAIYGVAERAAAGTINILILGETGVGKEVMAKTIHHLSPRRSGPSICLNCAALSESLLESELFGHEKGSFTGATSAKIGLLEAAEGGTLFLDEVGEMPPSTQVKLLRVIETREVTRIGSVRPKRIDVRFISATNRDLEMEVERNAFRRDLYFRLNGVSIQIPPLRERRGEIRPLAEMFLRDICNELGRPLPSLSLEVVNALESRDWPGNVRELKNVIERAVLLCGGTAIGIEHLPEERRAAAIRAVVGVENTLRSGRDEMALPELTPNGGDERQRILDALASCAGNQSRAAKLMGMPRRTFVAKLDRYQIPRPNKG
ncbi:MAG TPA: sigma 54-interacting transcriptional regulator [Polyangia bacterium]